VPAIEIEGLVKRYGELEAVAGIDLVVEEGEVFALLGPNGAGKTSTIEILEGHRARDAGQISVLGFDPAAGGRPLRERIGIVLQESGIDRELTVIEILTLYAPLYPDPRDPAGVIEIVGLTGKEGSRIKTLSGGQRRRLDLALGIIGDPELLFLDEPTTGFDPAARRRSWGFIDRLRSLGTTILLTTHYMDEAQQLADRVAVMADGRIVAEGTPDTIGARSAAEATITFRVPDGTGDFPAPFDRAIRDGDDVRLTTGEPTESLHVITGWALQRGVELDSLEVSRPSLEDVYLDLVGGEDG
jgi:ABC-2 type transport system ATP-binding protein